jgi:hypothetical protein
MDGFDHASDCLSLLYQSIEIVVHNSDCGLGKTKENSSLPYSTKRLNNEAKRCTIKRNERLKMHDQNILIEHFDFLNS